MSYSQHQLQQAKRNVAKLQSQLDQETAELHLSQDQFSHAISAALLQCLSCEHSLRDRIIISEKYIRDEMTSCSISEFDRILEKKREGIRNEMEQEQKKMKKKIMKEQEAEEEQQQQTPRKREQNTSTGSSSSPTIKNNIWSWGKKKDSDSLTGSTPKRSRNSSSSPTRRQQQQTTTGSSTTTTTTEGGGFFSFVSSLFSNQPSSSATNQPPATTTTTTTSNINNNNITSATTQQQNTNVSDISNSNINRNSFPPPNNEVNPNQLGELLTDINNPDWYTATCLSTSIQEYFSGKIKPQKVVLNHSTEEENVAKVVTNVAVASVETAVSGVRTLIRVGANTISGSSGSVTNSSSNNNNNNDNAPTMLYSPHRERSAFDSSPTTIQNNSFSGAPNNINNNSINSTTSTSSSSSSSKRPPYIVEPIWLHMQDNHIVTNTVQPSVFQPFPAFNQHNSDEKLRAAYREMSRRSEVYRARREGTTAAIPVVDHTAAGGFHANDARRLYNTTNASPSSCQNQQQQRQSYSSSSTSQETAPSSSSTSASAASSSGASRRIRADEFRVAFFATDLFSQIHESIDSFDVKELVEHARFDEQHSHPWRVASSPGKSDSLFFFFGHFVAKSLKEQEFRFLYERFLPAYAEHTEMNRFTLLPRFVALMSVADLSKGTSSIQRFVIMNNVFPTRRVIDRMYDLKGSTVNRDGLAGEITKTSFGAILLKDNDLPPKLLLLGPVRSRLLITQLRCDTDFLNSLSIIDYSLLVGVRSETVKVGAQGVIPTSTSQQLDGHCFRAWDGGMSSLPIFDDMNDMTTARIDTFYIGLIDVLQSYTPAKRFEAFSKELLFAGGASVVPPDQFAKRMVENVDRITE